jgi:hypothetical protein
MKAISQDVKSKVIYLFNQKKEYAEIVKILKQQNIQVSFGSCWNIVSSWKKQKQSDGNYNSNQSSDIKSKDSLVLDTLNMPQHNNESTNVSVQNTEISRPPTDVSAQKVDTELPTQSYTEIGTPKQEYIVKTREAHQHTKEKWRERADDPNGGWTMRTIILEMNKEKALQKRQLEQIDHRRRVLERKEEQLRHEREYIENSRNDLAVRESLVIAVEPLLPLARQLWESKIGFDLLLPWIETIREKAQTANVSMDIAAISAAQEIRNYRHVGGVSKCLQQIQNQILTLDTLYMHKQEAIGILMDLQSRGISETEIVRLVNLAGEWNKYWQSSKTNVNGNLQQPVNGSNNPGSSNGTFSGYGGNLSINDLIRLNLLKSTTTNILTRMETSRTTPPIKCEFVFDIVSTTNGFPFDIVSTTNGFPFIIDALSTVTSPDDLSWGS